MEYTIPERIKESLDRYVEHGIPTGDFLYAVLTNDLMCALGKADESNRAAIFDICAYVYNEIPGNCHGSKERVDAWIYGHKLAREAQRLTAEGEAGVDQLLEVSNADSTI